MKIITSYLINGRIEVIIVICILVDEFSDNSTMSQLPKNDVAIEVGAISFVLSYTVSRFTMKAHMNGWNASL